jgi:hypothetical protein
MRAFIVVLLASSAARAEPLPRAFVGLGAITGGDSAVDTANFGATLEAGLDVVGPLWLHGQATAGGTFDQLRAGVETRACGERTCGTFGLDVGYQVERIGHSVACGDEADCSKSYTGARMIPRVGLEFGKRLRWRPSLEADLGRGVVFGVHATFVVAYAW